VSDGVDYPMLQAFNPHLPPEPQEVSKPWNPESEPWWKQIPDTKQQQVLKEYQAAIKRWKEYEQAVEAWSKSTEFLAAQQELAKTIHDLERRGLLLYDHQSKRYDLHPVVRGIAAGGLKPAEKERYGQRVVDYFSRQAHRPYAQAETLEDLRHGIHIVHTLLKMGRFQEAYYAYSGDLAQALKFNVEADAECMALMRPFFPHGWSVPPEGFGERGQSYLANEAALALRAMGQRKESLAAFGVALLTDLREKDWGNVRTDLCNIAYVLSSPAKAERCLILAQDLAGLINDGMGLFVTGLDRFDQLTEMGQWEKAEALWHILDPMGRSWPRHAYRPGDAERTYVRFRFRRGDLREEGLACAERLAKEGKNRLGSRDLHALRGEWRLEQGQWSLAAESLHEAVRMAREVGDTNARAETQLALAKLHLHQLPKPRHVAEQLAQARKVFHRALAELWTCIGDHDQAKKHALEAYKRAWADGEPYVDRCELNKATALLKQLGTEIPNLAPYDPIKDEKLPWEDEVAAAIKRLRAGKKANKTKPKSRKKH
jgi:tetratricopeptide (TPR) repeat protein